MKHGVLLAVLCVVAVSAAPAGATIATAWFSDAALDDAVESPNPTTTIPEVGGTVGKGVHLTHAVPIENPALTREQGYISFWIKPSWSGNDGKTHRILRIGDPQRNGLLVEKSSKNMLRYVMASPAKITASRADVSAWKAGEWHHVVVIWMSKDGTPLGLPLWIDKVAVDGPIASGNQFLDPLAMDDDRLWIGDETSDAAMDELIVRDHLRTELSKGQIELVYRDYFRTAPFTEIAIDPEPHLVRADGRVVHGADKQFGLRGRVNGRMERLTEFVKGYSNWGYFDAKTFITWRTSDEAIATVDENGLVSGHSVGICTLTAEFRGLRASYELHVIPVEQPDLDLYLVERLPRYSERDLKWWPAPGDRVGSVAHIANYGYADAPAGAVVRFQLIVDANGNFRLDRNDRQILARQEVIGKALKPTEEATVQFVWAWPERPAWVRVTVDAQDRIPELCEVNNELVELTTAHPVRWGYNASVLKYDHEQKRINLTGSFSYYDWLRSQSDRVRVMLRDSVYPTTSPHGVLNDVRVDNFYAITPGKWMEEPFETEREYYDGGFPVADKTSEHLMWMASGLIHELGHTMLALPDLYGYPVMVRDIFLTDENGELYAGGELLPEVQSWGGSAFSSAQNVPCGVGYAYLMDYCHMVLHPVHAGQVQHFAGHRGQRFWGVQGHLIPFISHELQLYDLNDDPLAGAAVSVYHVTQTEARDAVTKFIADRPKFVGNTDERGRFVFPRETDKDWDSPETDEVDGAIGVWNPYGTATKDTAFTPNVWSVEGQILLKIVSGDQTEFAWLPMTQMNEAYFTGTTNRGVYAFRTNLQPSEGVTPVVRKPIPDEIKETNLEPVASVECEEALTVRCGETLRLDGSASHDPEGQPLIYRWHARDARGVEPKFSDKPAYEALMPDRPVEFEVVFYVIDGLRPSEPVWIKVHVAEAEAEAETETESE